MNGCKGDKYACYKNPWDETKSALDQIGIKGSIIIYDKFELAWDALNQDGPWRLLVSDISLTLGALNTTDLHGRNLLNRAKYFQVPSIAISGFPNLTPKNVRDILQEDGASDFIYKADFNGAEFRRIVQNLIILSFFSPSVWRLIADTVKRIPLNNLINVLKGINQIESKEYQIIQKKLQGVQREIALILRNNMLNDEPYLSTNLEELSFLFDTEKLDAKQKMKLVIPIIPLILTYIAEVDLPNLKEIWSWIKGKITT
jgi:hypothetical protein